MNWKDWYTDTVDVYRAQEVMDGNLTRFERVRVLSGIPCRVYQSDDRAIGMEQTASHVEQESHLACGVEADIQAGDELRITRGGRLGKPGPVIRAFAADPNYYYEPFGAIIPGLRHQEIRLLQQERVKGGVTDGGDTGGENQATESGAAQG